MSRPIQLAERALAGYFGTSPALARVPMLGETVRVYQEMAAHDADAVTRGFLFPALSPQQRSALTDVLHGRTPLPLAPRDSRGVAGTATTSSQDAQTSTRPATVCGSSRASALRATAREAYYFRILTNRFSSVVDGNKEFGLGEEVAYDELVRDVRDVWHDAKAAVRSLESYRASLHAPPTQQGTQGGHGPVPHHLVFLVAYSHTHGVYGVGDRMHTIQKRVRELVHHARLAPRQALNGPPGWAGLSSVLRVVPVTVGVQRRSPSPGSGHRRPSDKEACVAHEALDYPQGGLYTLNALLHIIQSLSVRQDTARAPRSGGEEVPRTRKTPVLEGGKQTLRHHTFILSDGWLHPRTMADLHQPTSPSSYTSTTDVVPGVVTDTLSDAETEAFARYIISQMRHL